MSESKHTEGRLHSHGRELHIHNEEPLDHICIANVNNALLEPQPVIDEFLRRWNSHDAMLHLANAVRDLPNKQDSLFDPMCMQIRAMAIAAIELAKKGSAE